MAMPTFIKPHQVALCIRYSDIVDRERLREETGIDLGPATNLKEALMEEGKLTIDQVFEFTPDANISISRCDFRPDAWTIKQEDAAGCYEHFLVSKFFTLEYMCYHVQERVPKKIHYEGVTKSTFSVGTFFTLFLNESLNSLDCLYPIAFHADGRVYGLPNYSRNHAQQLNHLRDKNRNFTRNGRPAVAFIHMIPADVWINRMEKPYDTQCTPVDQGYADKCRLNCYLDKLAPYNRVPGWELLDQRYKQKPISTKDIQHPTLGPLLRSFDYECAVRCDYSPCHEGFTVTKTQRRQTMNRAVGIALTSPIDPRIDLTSQATMSFVEFFSFICSCFGTWFGVSFLSLIDQNSEEDKAWQALCPNAHPLSNLFTSLVYDMHKSIYFPPATITFK